MNISLECKDLNIIDCGAFRASCVRNKNGKCQRRPGGLDLDQQKVTEYLDHKKKYGTVQSVSNET